MPTIEYVTVADHAEAINGKLYLHGAGWTDVFRPTGPDGKPGFVHIGVAVSILVGWNETNRRFPLSLAITHEDGDVLAQVNAQIEAGRPPGIPQGSDLRSVLAIGLEAQFPQLGGYRVQADLNGEQRAAVFRVHAQPQATGPSALLPPPGPAR